MSFFKQVVSYIPFDDDEKSSVIIELIHYSELSFALAPHIGGNLPPRALSKEEKAKMTEVKSFLGKNEDGDAESLGGKGGTNFTYEDGTKFFGYIYSIKNGQKAIDWFASRSELLPEKEDVVLPNDLEESMRDVYVEEHSRKTKEEIYAVLGMKPPAAKKYAAKSQGGPRLVLAPARSPTSVAKSPVQERLPGVPQAQAKAPRDEKSDITNALEVLFRAMKAGTFNESGFNYATELGTGRIGLLKQGILKLKLSLPAEDSSSDDEGREE